MAKPTSLELQCFLHILQHLETFSVESLSLLPLGVRQSILLSAPVADVFQLEHTRFVKGIDMDEVWKTVCEQRLPLIPSLPDLQSFFGDETPPRELMKTGIAFQILHVPRIKLGTWKPIPSQSHQPRYSTITSCASMLHSVLFSIILLKADDSNSADNSMELELQKTHPGLFEVFQLAVGRQEENEVQACRMLVPSRYALYDIATSDKNTKKVEDLMATTYKALPSLLFIDCNTLKCHNFRGELPIRGELLMRVESFSLNCDIRQDWLWGNDGAQPISSILTPLLHHSSALKHITFEKCSDERIHVITSQVARLLTSSTDHKLKVVTISVSSIGKNRRYGFCGNAWDGAFQELERKSQEASRNLGSMIPRISSLHTLQLEKWWTRHSEHAHQDHVKLLDVLCSFLKQPHFQCLSLVDTCLPLVYIQRLVCAFLQSPCSQSQTLRLEMLSLTSRLGLIHRLSGYYPTDKEIKLLLTEWDSKRAHSTISKAAQEFKTLTIAFHSCGEGHYRKDDLATLEATRSWLSDLSHFKYKLKSLIVQGDPCVA